MSYIKLYVLYLIVKLFSLNVNVTVTNKRNENEKKISK